jgi:hypothetical protein
LKIVQNEKIDVTNTIFLNSKIAEIDKLIDKIKEKQVAVGLYKYHGKISIQFIELDY